MRVALLTGANPRQSKGGPQVRLLSGKWRFETLASMHKPDRSASELVLTINGEPHEADELENHQTVIAQVFFKERGEENHISVFAVKVA